MKRVDTRLIGANIADITSKSNMLLFFLTIADFAKDQLSKKTCLSWNARLNSSISINYHPSSQASQNCICYFCSQIEIFLSTKCYIKYNVLLNDKSESFKINVIFLPIFSTIRSIFTTSFWYNSKKVKVVYSYIKWPIKGKKKN